MIGGHSWAWIVTVILPKRLLSFDSIKIPQLKRSDPLSIFFVAKYLRP